MTTHYSNKTKEKTTWTTDELRKDFEVIGFMAPYVSVRRKKDGVKGSLAFTHCPRLYSDFVKTDK